MLTKYPRFGSEIAVANIEFRDDLPFHTAATDGKNIYVGRDSFGSTVAPYLAFSFNKLVIGARGDYDIDFMKEKIEENDIDYVIFMFSI